MLKTPDKPLKTLNILLRPLVELRAMKSSKKFLTKILRYAHHPRLNFLNFLNDFLGLLKGDLRKSLEFIYNLSFETFKISR